MFYHGKVEALASVTRRPGYAFDRAPLCRGRAGWERVDSTCASIFSSPLTGFVFTFYTMASGRSGAKKDPNFNCRMPDPNLNELVLGAAILLFAVVFVTFLLRLL